MRNNMIICDKNEDRGKDGFLQLQLLLSIVINT